MPHTVIVDNAGGHLMQRGQVDVVIVGTDRTTAAGDVVNKVGTYLKALAARDCGVPFYVAAPSPSIDWTLEDGRQIEIEERSAAEVTDIAGTTDGGAVATVRLTPEGTPAANPAFDLDAGTAGHGAHHRTRRGAGQSSRLGRPLPDENDGPRDPRPVRKFVISLAA